MTKTRQFHIKIMKTYYNQNRYTCFKNEFINNEFFLQDIKEQQIYNDNK
jgi:hypothetical protein